MDNLQSGKEKITELLSSASDVINDESGRPKPTIIVSLFMVLLIIYLVRYYYRQTKYSPYLILDVISTSSSLELNKQTKPFPIPADKIPDSKYRGEYSYSMWIYVSSDALYNSSNSRIDQSQIILNRVNGTGSVMVYAIEPKKKK